MKSRANLTNLIPPPQKKSPKNKNKKTTDVKIYILFQLKLSPSAIKL